VADGGEKKRIQVYCVCVKEREYYSCSGRNKRRSGGG